MKTMTEMENAVMNMTGCNRKTANLVVNAILDIDRKTNMPNECGMCGKETNPEELYEHEGHYYCKDCFDNVTHDDFSI